MSEVADQRSAPVQQTELAKRLPLPPRPQPRQRDLVRPVAFVGAFVLILAWVIMFPWVYRSHCSRFFQQSVHVGNLQVAVAGIGPNQPRATYTMNFAVGGQVQSINVHIGQRVKAGQTLAMLTDTALRDDLTAAQHKLSAAQTAYNDAVRIWASQSVLDQDNANITSAQDAVQAAQHALRAATLKAPAKATVEIINGVVGQDINPGSDSTGKQPFMLLADTSALTIAAQINEADIAQVKTGQSAQFTVAAYPDQPFNARVADIQTYGQTNSNVVDYTVDLGVDLKSLKGANLYPGMTATVNITTAQRAGVLLVPNSALSFPSRALQYGELDRPSVTSLLKANRGSSAQNRRGIVLELQNGKLTPVLVTTGLRDGQYTEVLSGLSDGDYVVVGQAGGSRNTNLLSFGGNAIPHNNPGGKKTPEGRIRA